MNASVCIEQKGTVEEITSRSIRVRTLREASCGQCSAKSMCFLGESPERIVEVSDFTPDIKIGDTVGITISRSMGNKAIVLAYFIPFLCLITGLVLFKQLGLADWLSGILAISILIPYYLVLYLVRGRLQKTFMLAAHKK